MAYLVPPNHPPVDGLIDHNIVRLAASIQGVDKKSVNVPNTALWVQLKLGIDGGSLEIKKQKKLVYINLFCFEAEQMDIMFGAVGALYGKYNLGTPKRPPVPTWIHSIPVAESLLQGNELRLCQKLTVSYYWAAYGQFLKKRNPLN